MLFVGKGRNKKFPSTKALPPDSKSLEMKIKRSNLVCHGWVNCLNSNYEHLDPLLFGWRFENDVLCPFWFDGPSLPNEDEIMAQLRHENEIFAIPEAQEETFSDDETVTFDYVLSECSDGSSSENDV